MPRSFAVAVRARTQIPEVRAITWLLTRILLAVGADLKVMPVTLVEMSSADAAGVVKLQLLQTSSRDASGALLVPGQELAGSDGEGTLFTRWRRPKRLPSPFNVPTSPPVNARAHYSAADRDHSAQQRGREGGGRGCCDHMNSLCIP